MITRVKPDESRRIDIFYEGDENVTEVSFENPDKDLKWVLNYFRRGDKRPYSVPLREEEDNLIWTVTLADTAKPGMGIAQLVGSGKDQTKHSGSYSVFVGKSLVNPGDVPAVDKAFLDKVAKEAAEAQTAAENTKTLYNRIQAGLADGSFRGEKGEKGERGEQGAAGPTGPAGERGPEGKQGPIGPTGPQGPQGIQGEQGPIGPAGPTGPKGDQGERGLTGDTGPTGPKGDTGPQGVPGAKGEKGDTGPAGADGKDGAPGKDGLDAPQIDDTVVSDAAPWSSKKIIEMLCPPLEESGNPVTCEPVAGYPLGVVASWEPTQAGSGEPYPAGGGPNLLDISKCTLAGGSFGLAIAMVGDVLTIKGTVTSISGSSTSFFAVLNAPDTSLSGKGYKITAFASKGSIKIIYGLRTETETAIAIGMDLVVGQAVDVALRIMVSKDTPTAYAPYENIRPISGRDNVKVQRSGENLLDMSRVAENKGCTVEGSAIHLVDTSGWGSSYILFAPVYPAGTYTIQVDADAAKHGRFLLRGYDANGNMVDVSILPRMIGYEASYNVYYKSTLLYPYNPSGTHKVITFTVQGAAYFQVGISGGTSKGETSADFKNFALVPGSTPPTVYTPYRGDTLDLALPSTIYGGTVDAVTGEGEEAWKLVTLDGNWDIGRYREIEDTDTYKGFVVINAVAGIDISRDAICSHFKRGMAASEGYHPNEFVAHYPAGHLYLRAEIPGVTSVDTFKAYLAAQYAAGTPVQIAYKLAEPVPFQATGNGPLLPIPGQTNTAMTDADSVTVTGRADPIRIIQQLQAAQSTAAVQLAETQQAMVDTTAMAVDYIYEQDSQIF